MDSLRPRPSKPVKRHVVLGVVLGLVLVLIGVAAFAALPREVAPITVTELSRLIEAGQVERLTIDGERMTLATVSHGDKLVTVGDDLVRAEFVRTLSTEGIPVEYTASTADARTRIVGLSVAAMGALVVGFWAFSAARRRRVSHFHVREPHEGVHGFEAVAGMEEVKRALMETVEFLRSPDRFAKLGGRPPRGILLTGEPGTGKTLLARAAAAEAGVVVVTCSGASFQEMFVGVGAARIRRLFAEARRRAPCVVFIDEVDSVGKKRGASSEGAASEHDQTLNQLLVELDGFDVMSGIVVIATTNRADVLDPALVRPGRFDRHIHVSLPTQSERRAILAVHAAGKPLASDVDLDACSRTTCGFSGADLANLLNEAAMSAARDHADEIDVRHLDDARDRVLMGTERHGMLTDPSERYATAVHEAGHTAVAMTTPCCDRVEKVSILPRERSLGVTVAIPERDRLMFSREHLEDRLCMFLGGRAAEIEVLGTVTAGAADDIRRACELARKMVAELGMSALGCIHVAGSGSPGAERVEREAARLIAAQLERARAIVRSRRQEVGALADSLVQNDTLGRTEVWEHMPPMSIRWERPDEAAAREAIDAAQTSLGDESSTSSSSPS